jgi:hypothetical protein
VDRAEQIGVDDPLDLLVGGRTADANRIRAVLAC